MAFLCRLHSLTRHVFGTSEKSNHEKSDHEKSDHEKSNHEKSNHEKSNHEKSNHEKSNHEKSNHEKSNHEKSNHEKSNHEKSDIVRTLPPEILDMILRLLSVTNQICFSLTCRTLYKHYISFMKARGTQPFALFPIEKRQIQNIAYIQPRADQRLLFRLQDSRWRYCSGFWKLHPQSAWCPPPPSSPQQSEEKLECMPYAGSVQLCYCLTITFTDVKRLVQHTKYGSPFKHECTFRGHPYISVPIISILHWNETGDKIILTSQYIFNVALKKSSTEKEVFFNGIDTPLLTSQKNVKEWLRKFFDESGSSFNGWKNANAVMASLSHFYESGGPVYNRYRDLVITVERNLGNGEWSDGNWKLNCCNSSEPKKQRLLAFGDSHRLTVPKTRV